MSKKIVLISIFILLIGFLSWIFLAEESPKVVCDFADTKCLVENSQTKFEHLSATKFKDYITTNKATVLDIRTLEEYNSGHITENPLHTDYYQTTSFENYLKTLDKDKTYLIYCRTDNRTGSALSTFQKLGFKEVYDLDGGIVSWQKLGYQVYTN